MGLVVRNTRLHGRVDVHLEAPEGSLLEGGVAAEYLGGQRTHQSRGVVHPSQVFQACQERQPVLGQASPQPSSGTACVTLDHRAEGSR